jgi:hypothetical protein
MGLNAGAPDSVRLLSLSKRLSPTGAASSTGQDGRPTADTSSSSWRRSPGWRPRKRSGSSWSSWSNTTSINFSTRKWGEHGAKRTGLPNADNESTGGTPSHRGIFRQMAGKGPACRLMMASCGTRATRQLSAGIKFCCGRFYVT